MAHYSVRSLPARLRLASTLRRRPYPGLFPAISELQVPGTCLCHINNNRYRSTRSLRKVVRSSTSYSASPQIPPTPPVGMDLESTLPHISLSRALSLPPSLPTQRGVPGVLAISLFDLRVDFSLSIREIQFRKQVSDSSSEQRQQQQQQQGQCGTGLPRSSLSSQACQQR